ncbi:ABC transporter ATP-binding protein, partial [Oryctes borbonicus]
DKPCGKYSGGNKRKLSTCISIIGFPSCILLDEPTSGVDPVSRRELWDFITEIKYSGETSILLTSHSMDECEALCDSLCVLKQGKVIENSSIEQLKRQYCVGHVLDIKLEKPNSCNENANTGEAPTADQT